MGSAAPANIAANKTAILELWSHGSAALKEATHKGPEWGLIPDTVSPRIHAPRVIVRFSRLFTN